MALSKRQFWHSNNSLHFKKCSDPLSAAAPAPHVGTTTTKQPEVTPSGTRSESSFSTADNQTDMTTETTLTKTYYVDNNSTKKRDFTKTTIPDVPAEATAVPNKEPEISSIGSTQFQTTPSVNNESTVDVPSNSTTKTKSNASISKSFPTDKFVETSSNLTAQESNKDDSSLELSVTTTDPNVGTTDSTLSKKPGLTTKSIPDVPTEATTVPNENTKISNDHLAKYHSAPSLNNESTVEVHPPT